MSTAGKLRVLAVVVCTACRSDVHVPQQQPGAPPVADAGTGSRYLVASTVTLDASNSSSRDGRALTYSWRLAARPAGSSAVIADPSAKTTSVVLDWPGEYVAELTVTDDTGTSDQSSVTNIAVAPDITLDAGMDQSVSWLANVQLGGTYQVEAGFPATLQWSFVSRPPRSTAVMVGADTLAPSFRADAEGEYVVQLAVWTSYNAATANIKITSTAQREVLAYKITDVEYSTALDRFVIVSDGPPSLRIHDPATGAESAVALSASPHAVSIEPGGLRAVVSHDHLITLVDLQSAAIVATYAPALDVGSVVFGADGRVHCIPTGTTTGNMYTVTLGTGTIVEDSPWVWASRGRLHPNGLRMYIASCGIHPSWLMRWDVSISPVAIADNWTNGEAPDCDMWFIHGGSEVIAPTLQVFTTTDATSTDMVYQTTLSTPVVANASTIDPASAQESTAANTIATLSTTELSYISGNYLTILATYDDLSLASRDTILVPDTPYNSTTYTNRARLVSFSADGSKQYVVVDATYLAGGEIPTTAFSVIYTVP
jgi:hypothetical protein